MATDRRTPWPAAAPARPQRAASSATRLPQPASEAAPRPALNLPGLKDDLFTALDLVSAPPRSEQPPVHFLETGSSAPALSFDAGTGSAVPPDAAGVSGSAGGASGGPSFVASNAASPDEASLLALMNFLPPGGGSGGSGNQQGQSTGPGSGGGSGQDDPRQPPRGRGRDGTDPLWVLDANNGLYLASGGTVHDFAGWNVDLYAQVSGATVASYVWGYSEALDLDTSTIAGQGTYHFHFQWNDFNDPQYLTIPTRSPSRAITSTIRFNSRRSMLPCTNTAAMTRPGCPTVPAPRGRRPFPCWCRPMPSSPTRPPSTPSITAWANKPAR